MVAGLVLQRELEYSANGVTPDAFINQQYAQYTDAALGGRGLAFSRAYGSLTAGGYGNPQAVPTGPWADKRTTLHFTGDTTSSWDMLEAEVGYTPGESAATGLAAISHDIGGHNGAQYGIEGAEPGTTQLPADLYARWVQLGTFQPVDRLHSNHSDRLPWQYPAAANASAKQFLNLREDLVPLTYTLAAQASATGTPILQPLYLQYPGAQESYAHAGGEYLYGKDVLVAPVTTAGATASTSVWFPAGSDWTDWFTGKTYRGGTTASVTTGLDAMPVFVRSGGIVPTRTHHVANDGAGPLDAVTLTVANGASGSFDLYEDADGTGTGTSAGAARAAAAPGSATTAVRYTQQRTGGTLTVAPVDGSFPGQVQERSWTASVTNADRPASVTVDGRPVAATAWSYDAATRTLTVPIDRRAVTQRTTVQWSTVAAAAPVLGVDRPTVAARWHADRDRHRVPGERHGGADHHARHRWCHGADHGGRVVHGTPGGARPGLRPRDRRRFGRRDGARPCSVHRDRGPQRRSVRWAGRRSVGRRARRPGRRGAGWSCHRPVRRSSRRRRGRPGERGRVARLHRRGPAPPRPGLGPAPRRGRHAARATPSPPPDAVTSSGEPGVADRDRDARLPPSPVPGSPGSLTVDARLLRG